MIVQHVGTVPYDNWLLRALMRFANRAFTKPMLRGADQVVFISQITRNYFQRFRYKKPPTILFNGVDTNFFSPAPDPSGKAALRGCFGLPLDSKVALFVGRFVNKKGIPVLETMARLAPDIFWVFTGEGPLNPGAWGLENVKTFSQLNPGRLADLYRACDVFILPSQGEGFPLVVQEALACGLPVVCSSEIATADDVLAGFVRGVSVPPGNRKFAGAEFLKALRETLNIPQSNEMVRQRYQLVLGRYSWPRVIEHYLKMIREIVEGRSRTRELG